MKIGVKTSNHLVATCPPPTNWSRRNVGPGPDRKRSKDGREEPAGRADHQQSQDTAQVALNGRVMNSVHPGGPARSEPGTERSRADWPRTALETPASRGSRRPAGPTRPSAPRRSRPRGCRPSARRGFARAGREGAQRRAVEERDLHVAREDVAAHEPALPLDAAPGRVPAHRLAHAGRRAHDEGVEAAVQLPWGT